MYTYYTKEGKFEIERAYDIPWENLHREDGPALIYRTGTKERYKNGERRRLDGPVYISDVDVKEWRVNGELHRINGPAIEYENGFRLWCIYNKELDTEEVESWIKLNHINLKTKEHQVLFMLMFG